MPSFLSHVLAKLFPVQSHEWPKALLLFSLIVAGKVEIVQQRASGPRMLVTLTAGDFFGDIALVGDQPRSASAVVVTPTVFLTLSPAHFRQIVLEDPAMSFEIFRALSACIRRADEATQEVGG